MRECRLKTSYVCGRNNVNRAFELNEKDLPWGESVSKIADYLNVEKSKRYLPGSGDTFCNIYAFDVTNLFGHYLPRVWWKDPFNVKVEEKPSYGTNCKEMDADSLYAWFDKFGNNFGWEKVQDPKHAQLMVNGGYFGIVVADNKTPGHSGHITVIHPETKEYQAEAAGKFMLVQTQAGATNKRIFRKDWYNMPYFKAWGIWVNTSIKKL